MEHLRRNTLLDRTFQLSITLKGLDGILQIIGALLFLRLNPEHIHGLINTVTLHLLSPAQNAYVSYHLLHATQIIAGHAARFIFIFLLSHGAAKVVLVTALWFNRLWAYPMMIVLLAGFSAYQIFLMAADGPTVFLALLTAFDIFVIWLTKLEYSKEKMQRSRRAEAACV